MAVSTGKITKNISQIEALIKRINDENKKTKEVLEKIDRGEFRRAEEGGGGRKGDDEGDEEVRGIVGYRGTL